MLVLSEALGNFSKLKFMLIWWKLDMTPYEPFMRRAIPLERFPLETTPLNTRDRTHKPSLALPATQGFFSIVCHGLSKSSKETVELGLGITPEFVDELFEDLWAPIPSHIWSRIKHVQVLGADSALDARLLVRDFKPLSDILEGSQITSRSLIYAGEYMQHGHLRHWPQTPPVLIPGCFQGLTRLELKYGSFTSCDLCQAFKDAEETMEDLSIIECSLHMGSLPLGPPAPQPHHIHLWGNVFRQLQRMTKLSELHLYRLSNKRSGSYERGTVTPIQGQDDEAIWSGDAIPAGIKVLCSDYLPTPPFDPQGLLPNPTPYPELINLRKANRTVLEPAGSEKRSAKLSSSLP